MPYIPQIKMDNTWYSCMRKAMAKMLLELLWKLSTMVGSFEHIYLLLLLNYLPFLFDFPIHSLCNYTFDHMSGVMVNVLPSSTVDHQTGHIKYSRSLFRSPDWSHKVQ